MSIQEFDALKERLKNAKVYGPRMVQEQVDMQKPSAKLLEDIRPLFFTEDGRERPKPRFWNLARLIKIAQIVWKFVEDLLEATRKG